MKNNLKLNQFSALIFKGFLCVLASVLTSSYTRFDVFCNSRKSFEQEKNSHFKICILQSKIFFPGSRQATYNQLPLEELKTMNFIQSIINLFGRRETKRQGKYFQKSIRELKAEQDRLLNKINKENGKADIRAYKNKMTRIEYKEGKL